MQNPDLAVAADLIGNATSIHPGPLAPGDRYQAIQTVDGVVILDRGTGQYALVHAPAASSTAAPAAEPSRGVSPFERKLMVISGCASALLLAVGGGMELAGHGIAAAGPALHELAGVLEWLCWTLVVLAAGLVVLLGRRVVRGGGGGTVHNEHHYHTESHGFLSSAKTTVRE